MLEVLKATPEMTADIVGLLQGFNNPRIDSDLWRKFLHYPWRRPEDAPGFVLFTEGRAVGFLGTVFSERTIDGKTRRFCNFAAWIVKPQYRSSGAYLLKQILALENTTILNMTPSPMVEKGLIPHGFETLDTRAILTTCRAWGLPPFSGVRVHSDPVTLAEKLDDKGRAILKDHASYPCHHAFIERGAHGTHVVFGVRPAGRLDLAWIHHLGDLKLFKECLGPFTRWLLWKHRAGAVAVESRFLKGVALPAGREIALPNRRLYRPNGVAPEKISNLYTELAMLNL